MEDLLREILENVDDLRYEVDSIKQEIEEIKLMLHEVLDELRKEEE